MSDMKTKAAAKKSVRRRAVAPKAKQRVFTVRDLNRQPQAVLNAARKAGGVHVQSRNGERFLVKPDPEANSAVISDVEYRRAFHERLRELHARMKAEGMGFTAEGWETFSKTIAGE